MLAFAALSLLAFAALSLLAFAALSLLAFAALSLLAFAALSLLAFLALLALLSLLKPPIHRLHAANQLAGRVEGLFKGVGFVLAGNARSLFEAVSECLKVGFDVQLEGHG